MMHKSIFAYYGQTQCAGKFKIYSGTGIKAETCMSSSTLGIPVVKSDSGQRIYPYTPCHSEWKLHVNIEIEGG